MPIYNFYFSLNGNNSHILFLERIHVAQLLVFYVVFYGFWLPFGIFDLCFHRIIIKQLNRIDGVMVSVLASSAVDRGFEPRLAQTKTKKLVFVASPLSTQHSGKRAMTGWLGIITISLLTCSRHDIAGKLLNWR